MLWLGAALIAACVWGLSYAISEHALKSGLTAFTMMTIYCAVALPFFAIISSYDGALQRGIELMRKNPKLIFWVLLMLSCYVAGNALVFWAIKQKNATAVSFVEISYPLFVAMFSYLLFQTNNITLGTIIGGALIFSGVCVMYLVK